ncbi:MAG: TonB-dependent receptor [Bacteroidota bacterium]
MKKVVYFLFILLSYQTTQAQQVTQTIKGTLVDAQSKYPLLGANVVVVGASPFIGSSTNEKGQFKLSGVTIGRQTLKITYLGYAERTISNIVVTAGKEVELNLELEEQVITGEEVVITAVKDGTVPNNELATVSARSFDPEGTARFAGSRNDPARMAANFAGVSGANDARNDIVIRGNSPAGLLWRLEDINIPNPNHYGALGTSGGPVSMLNNNVLDKSDFLTAAFPAQYGNALAGVFDLKMRNGNHDKKEFLGQVGFNGFELGAEGPFSKKSKASYLVNYRYSTLGVFKAVGINFGTGTAVPQYQDLTFKIDVPTAKSGRFSIFGLGGASSITLLGSEADTTKKDLFGDDDENSVSKFQTGVIGVSHMYYFNPSTYYKLSLSASHSLQQFAVDSLSIEDRSPFHTFDVRFAQNKYSANLLVNKKFSARNNLTTGIIIDILDFSLNNSQYDTQLKAFKSLRNTVGKSVLTQAYSQWQHRFTEQLTLNTGLNFQHFSLNNSTTLEPRLGLKYQMSERQSIGLGYGMHSQMQPLMSYFNQTRMANGTYIQTNRALSFTRSQHVALSFERMLTTNLRMKVETYFQDITKAAVEQRATSFSMLNAGADFTFPENDSLVNGGKGQNYGVELTLERFYGKGFYLLATFSLFDSRYKGSDGIQRNTAFNGHYVVNFLAGREIKVGKKNNVFNIDWKITTAGGKYVTPINQELSKIAGSAVYRHEEAYSVQLNDYFRSDIKFSFRMNRKKLTHEMSLDLQNLTGRKNIYSQAYNSRTNEIGSVYQIGFFPVPQYRLLF